MHFFNSLLFVFLISSLYFVPGNSQNTTNTSTDPATDTSKTTPAAVAAATATKSDLPSKEVINNAVSNGSQNDDDKADSTPPSSSKVPSDVPTRATTSQTLSTQKPLVHSSSAAIASEATEKNTNSGNSVTPASTTQQEGKSAGTRSSVQSVIALFGVVMFGSCFM